MGKSRQFLTELSASDISTRFTYYFQYICRIYESRTFQGVNFKLYTVIKDIERKLLKANGDIVMVSMRPLVCHSFVTPKRL